jgi:3-methyl-2-oxobutanoate hydroxymethyltransferase
LRKDAEDLAAAGAGMIILEMIPATLARELTESLSVPVIGIGAGAGCSGQVLVLHDMLGLSLQKTPKFVRNFLDGTGSIQAAVQQYVADVKASRFPDDALHAF